MITRRTSFRVCVVASTAVAFLLTRPVRGIGDGLLTGTITSAAGTPLEGVVVSALVDDESITTSVYTGADGRYFFPPMKASRYKVWAQAVGLDRSEAALDLDSG